MSNKCIAFLEVLCMIWVHFSMVAVGEDSGVERRMGDDFGSEQVEIGHTGAILGRGRLGGEFLSTDLHRFCWVGNGGVDGAKLRLVVDALVERN